MIEVSDSEIDLEQLMDGIRRAVERREASGERSLIGASVELYELLAGSRERSAEREELPPLRLQPEFRPRPDDHYHINDLLQYHDHRFVWNAYRAILKREPDETGLNEYLRHLRSGRFNKIDVLASLRFSGEGKARRVRVDGLVVPAVIRRLYRLPLIGYLLETTAAVARLPALLRSQRQLESHLLAQQELLTTYLNDLRERTTEDSQTLSQEMSQLTKEQQNFSTLHHQQVVGLFREQRELAERLRFFKEELDGQLAQLVDETKRQHPSAVARAKDESIQPPLSADDGPAGMEELLAAFTEQFRGDREKVKEGLRVYLPLVREATVKGEIVDLGCGRGEWLELLREEGFDGRGIDTNPVLVAENRERGLNVSRGEALSHLRALPDNSLGVVTAFHLIEHLSFAALIQLLDEIRRTLWPGGLLIFETPNPKNLVVGACNFYSDPTHYKPLFPETVQFLLHHRGFTDTRVQYLNPVAGSPFDDASESGRALDGWFYGPRDFAIIGRKKSIDVRQAGPN